MAEGSSRGSLKRSSVEEDESSKPPPKEELAIISRRIADALQPEETVKQALRRLNGSSNDKKQKMSKETRFKGPNNDKKQKMSKESILLFEQLTGDATKLVLDGDFNAYNEKREHFESKAEDYDKLARARKPDTAAEIPATESIESSHTQTNYVYDQSSGYYYDPYTGYYYDASSGLYWYNGKWYHYNFKIGVFIEALPKHVTEVIMKSEMWLVLQWGETGFTIHGGWPKNKDIANRSNKEFDMKLFSEPLIKDLEEFWPSIKIQNLTYDDNQKFWKHEWDDHGQYSGLTQDVYFERLVDIVKSFQTKDFGLAVNTFIPVSEIISRIKSAIHVAVKIRASRIEPANRTLHRFTINDIWILLDVHMKMKDVAPYKFVESDEYAPNRFDGHIGCESYEVKFPR